MTNPDVGAILKTGKRCCNLGLADLHLGGGQHVVAKVIAVVGAHKHKCVVLFPELFHRVDDLHVPNSIAQIRSAISQRNLLYCLTHSAMYIEGV